MTPAVRRNSRPRRATASSRIYLELRNELVSLRRRPGEAIEDDRAFLRLAPNAGPRSNPEIGQGLVAILPQWGIFVFRIPLGALPQAIVLRKVLGETSARLVAERAALDRYRRPTRPQPGRVAQLIAEHVPILAAIESHDPSAAGVAMESHLDRLLHDISATPLTDPEFFHQQT